MKNILSTFFSQEYVRAFVFEDESIVRE
jgi:hypothetical protein